MTTQPEALRLAEVAPYLEGGERGQWIMSAADELRRLHEANTELLSALKALVKADAPDCIKSSIWQQAFVAINKAERTT
jgi:hypothetical protein